MERRTFLETFVASLGVPASILTGARTCFGSVPTRPIRSKPYMEAGRPEYEEPSPVWVDLGAFCTAVMVAQTGGPIDSRLVEKGTP